ncbi:MAG: DUF7525 family protein [Halobacteriota archaeon]
METQTAGSDMGIGLALVFGFLAVGAAGAMLVLPDQLMKAWGFAGAMVAGMLAVLVIHLYWSNG